MHRDCLILSIWLKSCKSYPEGILLLQWTCTELAWSAWAQTWAVSGVRVPQCTAKERKCSTYTWLHGQSPNLSSSLRLSQDNGSQQDPRLTQAGKVQGPQSVSPSLSHKHWLQVLHMKTFNGPDFSQTQIPHKHIDTQTAQLKLRVAWCGFSCKCSETQGNRVPAADGMGIVTRTDFFTCQNNARLAMSLTSPTLAGTSLSELAEGHSWAEGIKSQFCDFLLTLWTNSPLKITIPASTECTAIYKRSNWIHLWLIQWVVWFLHLLPHFKARTKNTL